LWKKIVYTTNHRNPEKDLFVWENFAQTVRFLLLDSFSDTDPGLTTQMKTLQDTIPSMFTSLLAGNNELPGVAMENDGGGGASTSVEMRPVGDAAHASVLTIGRLKTTLCESLSLPVKESGMTEQFRAELTAAYFQYYGRQITIMGTRTQALKWWKKVSW
jgi:hypothetical protein